MQLNQSYQKLTGTGKTTYMSHSQKKGRGQDSQKIEYERKNWVGGNILNWKVLTFGDKCWSEDNPSIESQDLPKELKSLF